MPASVSVVIPTYNRAKFLGEAVTSALGQTRPPDEIIVVDDGSTDATEQMLARFGEKVRYLRQANAGPAAARNHGIRIASGNFIAFLDSDDLWTPDKIARQLAFFGANPRRDFVFADMANFTGPNTVDAPEIKNRELHDYLARHSTHLEDLFSWLLVENVIPTPTVMGRRAAIEKVGRFNESLRIAEDLDYWLRAAEMCEWGFIDAVLLHRRRHESNLISDVTRRNLALLSVLRETAKRPAAQTVKRQELIATKYSAIHYDVGSAYFRARDFRNASHHFDRVQASGMRRVKIAMKRVSARMLTALGTERHSG